MQSGAPVQRLRVKFARGAEIEYISHLDVMRAWERALRRATIPLAYSHGFHPQPRIALAAPLPVGVTSEGELMDVFLCQRLQPREFLNKVRPQLPPGLEILDVREVPLEEPSLQSRVRFADYRADIRSDLPGWEIEERVRQLLEATEVLGERRREGKVRRYNLRPLVERLVVESWNESKRLRMRLRNSPSGAARPDEVVEALGLERHAARVHREHLLLDRE